jgi:hypothetical protein
MHPLRQIAAITAALCLAQGALSQTLPPPESVSLDKLGFMSTFPPIDAQRVDLTNSYKYPQLRWVTQHLRELVPSRNIRHGSAPVAVLPVAGKPIGNFVFDDDKGNKTTIDDWFKSSYSDAIVVLHKGRIVYERYDNQMKPWTPHLLFSVTKSFTGLMAA